MVALTGGVATGKSTVADIMASQGVPVVDTDLLAREAVRRQGGLLEALAGVAGPGILDASGAMDRRALLRKMLSSKDIKAKVEELLHPEVLRLLDARLSELASRGERLVVVEVPLLFEAGWEGLFDLSVCVVSPDRERERRIRERCGGDWELMKALSSTQLQQEEKARRADLVIVNDSSVEELEDRVREALGEIKVLSPGT